MNITELIAEAERLDAEATKGPWGIHPFTEDRKTWDRIESASQFIATCATWPQANSPFIARSRTLLPLLVAVIKNQQRQIEELKDGLGDMLDGESQSYRRETFESVNKSLAELEAELEDVKPC